MRIVILAAIAGAVAMLAGACSLDVSSKPECLVDNDCNYYYPTGYCIEQVCVANERPLGIPDVFYLAGATTADKLEGDVVANDIDPEGRALQVHSVQNPNTWVIFKTGPSTVEIDAKTVPATFFYKVTDGITPAAAWTEIRLARLTTRFEVRMASGDTASLRSVFAQLVDQSPDVVELVTPPSNGTLTGTAPDVDYATPIDYCGRDQARYRVRAANGTFDITVDFEVGFVLAGEQHAMGFGRPVSLDVLDNDPLAVELVSVDSPFATLAPDNRALIVDPPATAGTHHIKYTARDSRGCEATATLRLDVEFPTQVVVGEGLTGDAFDGVLSHDGRFLAFTSADTTLVPGDTNSAPDVFVLDIHTNDITRVSVATGGAQANEGSGNPTISADGRYIAFVSRATNLVPEDTTSVEDIYLHDRVTGTTSLVSISVDDTGSDRASLTPHISADGNRIVFASSATRLIANDTNEVLDIFVRDVTAGTTIRASVTGAGAQAPFASHVRPRISGNGRYVALSSSSSLDGTNSSGAFLVDTAGGAVTRILHSGEVDIDDAGRFVIHASSQVTLLDRVVENTTQLGTGTFPSLSASGRYAAYVSGKQIFARGPMTTYQVIVDPQGMPVQVTPLRRPEISGDGRWIVFATSEWPGHEGRFVLVRVWNRAFSG